MSVPGTTTYNQAKNKCSNSGGQLCSVAEICPRGSLYDTPLGKAEGGMRSSNTWVPTRDAYNAWVDIGNVGETDGSADCALRDAGADVPCINQRHCRLHRTSRNVIYNEETHSYEERPGYTSKGPEWGTKTDSRTERSKILCCQMANSVFDTDIEAGRPQSLTWSITGGERYRYEKFRIDYHTGVVMKRSGGGLNFEYQNYYWLNIRVRDTGVGSLYDEAPLQIEIQDVNEAPWGWGQNAYLQENRNGGVRMTSSLRAWDWDSLDQGKITWDMDGGYAGFNRHKEAIPFMMTPGSYGEIKSTGPTNYERIPIYFIRARITDSGWDYPTKSYEKDGTTTSVTREQAKLSGIVIVTVIIVNRNDQPKLDDSERRVDENTARRGLMPDTLVGTTLAIHAVEEDFDDALTWTIISPGSHPFRISNDGQLFVKHRTQLNYEGTSSYTLTIKIKDSGCSVCQHHSAGNDYLGNGGKSRQHRLSDTAVVKIHVNDLNEAALFRSSARTRSSIMLESLCKLVWPCTIQH